MPCSHLMTGNLTNDLQKPLIHVCVVVQTRMESKYRPRDLYPYYDEALFDADSMCRFDSSISRSGVY